MVARNRFLKIRVSEQEKKLFKSGANTSGMNLSVWARQCLVLAARKKPIESYRELIRAIYSVQTELNCVGNNINQLTRYAHSKHEQADLVYIKSQLQGMSEKINSLR